MIRSALRRSCFAAFAFGISFAAVGQPAGLVTVTDSHGVPPAGAIFSSFSNVYFTVGPFPEGTLPPDCVDGALPDGDYVFQVTDNSGKTVLSGDSAANRVFTIAGGVIVSTSGTHVISSDLTACGGSWLAVSPFSRAPHGAGVYKLWIAASSDVIGCPDGTPCGFTAANSIRTNFVVREDIRCLETHCLSGLVFEDSNGDGILSSVEPGLPNVTVVAIDGSGNSVETVTNQVGGFSMCALPETSYRVLEIVPTGYRQTSPAGKSQLSRYLSISDFGYSVKFCNEDFSNLVFGNFPLPGSIAGTKFSDPNGNGLQDAGEPGLAGVTVVLADAMGHTVAQQKTDASGAYQFDNLVHGAYTVSEVVPAGYRQTLPGGAGALAVDLAPGQAVTGADFGNQKLGRVTGRKFGDVNGNGVRDSGEIGIPGVTITLLAPDGSTQSAVTAADGTYAFNNLVPGDYALSEVVPPGYRQTRPGGAGTIAVTVSSGKESSGNLFGNQLVGSITGFKFEDLNGNGVQDPEDGGLPNVKISLAAPDGSTQTSDSAIDGLFGFENLPPGDYVLSEDVPPAFYQTYPGGSGRLMVTVAGGEISHVKFGNRLLGALSGMKFNDLNGNGLLDSGEPGMPGITVILKAPGGTTSSTVTAADGTFSFAGLIPGDYSISEIVPPGFAQTAPGGTGELAVTVLSGKTVGGLLIGNHLLPPGSISGAKFEDSNGNGLRDAGEPALSGVTINLRAPDGSTTSALTAADGSFSFAALPAGSYILSETVPENYRQTAPGGDGTISVTVASGKDSGGNLFGNQLLPGSIAGFIFEDTNKNRIQNPGEGPLAGVTVQLLDAANHVVATTLTAKDGTFLFSGVAAGSYNVHPIPPPTFFQTLPALNKPIPVNLTPGSSVTGLVFGLTC